MLFRFRDKNYESYCDKAPLMGKPRIRISLVTNIETVEWSFGRQVLEAPVHTVQSLVEIES